MARFSSIISASISLLLLGCSSHARPNSIDSVDSTLAGSVLGAGWGAGAGAVIGNQVSSTGEGAAIGAAFGLVDGALTGAGHDAVQDELYKQERELDALRVRTDLTARELREMQSQFTSIPANLRGPQIYTIYFDNEATGIRAGTVAKLEQIADSLRQNRFARQIVIRGHTDDSGSPEYNKRVAESRARSVYAYLAQNGIATDRMEIESLGSTQPELSNATSEGRQLNRRVEVVVLTQRSREFESSTNHSFTE
jgi:outer membrane protein OmpA-like peptidoglycan-associated protein